MTLTAAPDADARTLLRRRLLTARRDWATTPAAEAAQQVLAERLQTVLAQLEPQTLGLYWPVKGEFNPRDVALSALSTWHCGLALPFAQRDPVVMTYRPWDGGEPGGVDDCGLPSPATTKTVEPDVVLVPCLGFTAGGFRLGYGGGYFDRYLAAHPGVTAVGLAWDEGLLTDTELMPAAHDIPLLAVLTPSGVWGG